MKEDLVQATSAPAASTSRSPERREWQPIETAPRDGTKILVWLSYGFPVVAYWQSGKFNNPHGGVWMQPIGNHGHAQATMGDEYANWTPLPEPPSNGDREIESKGEEED